MEKTRLDSQMDLGRSVIQTGLAMGVRLRSPSSDMGKTHIAVMDADGGNREKLEDRGGCIHHGPRMENRLHSHNEVKFT